jgi:protein-L-isoaspartate(D-aspartate) O-methyltransferase
MVARMFEERIQWEWARSIAAPQDVAGFASFLSIGEPPHSRFELIARHYEYLARTGRSTAAIRRRREDVELARLAHEGRVRLLPQIARRAAMPVAGPMRSALERVPRERFVPVGAIEDSLVDAPVLLGDGKRSTVSAMHAYVLTFELAGIERGHHVLDLGAGTGYGTALLSELVGPGGFVRSVEIDPALAATARDELDALGVATPREVHAGDALDARFWTGDLDRVVVGFALPELPRAQLARLRPGAVVVAPLVTDGDEQRLARITAGPEPAIEWHHLVRFVPAQSAPPS